MQMLYLMWAEEKRLRSSIVMSYAPLFDHNHGYCSFDWSIGRLNVMTSLSSELFSNHQGTPNLDIYYL